MTWFPFFADLPNGEFSKRLCVQGISLNISDNMYFLFRSFCILHLCTIPLSEYNNFLTLLPCSRDNGHQVFKVRLAKHSTSSFSRSFHLLLPSGRCLRPHERRAAPLESPGLRGIFGLDGCPAQTGIGKNNVGGQVLLRCG